MPSLESSPPPATGPTNSGGPTPWAFIRSREEVFSSLSHFLGVILSLIGTAVLLGLPRRSLASIAVILIYGASNVFLFFASGLYHALKRHDDEVTLPRKLDHIAIYVMIAGTYTPVCFLFLTGAWFWTILLSQWFCVICGLIFKLFVLNNPRWLTIGIYLFQGWMAVIPVGQLGQVMTPVELGLMVSGGITYTIGALIYNRKWPNPSPGRFGFHEIFHVCILIGASLHFGLIFLGFSA